MKIILAKPRGFCAGVNMAISALEEAIEKHGTPFYVFHEIVHNTHVVESFRKRGVVFVDTIEDIPEGSPVMFSAHGISPEIREFAYRRNLLAIDATCPLVRKVHEEVLRFARKNVQIVLIGHPGHDEVIGVMGEAPHCIQLVAKPEDVDKLCVDPDEKVAYVMQTTLSLADAKLIVERLRKRFPQILAPPTADICYATQNRQETVRRLVKSADVLLVLGSANSSNSRRLSEIGREVDIPSYLIDSPQEIDLSAFHQGQTVLITSGASAPETVVQLTVDLLRETFGASVEESTVFEESLHFPLPRELR